MRQVFVDAVLESGGRAVIEGEDYAHLARVLRLKAGEALSLVDAKGRRFDAKVSAITRSQVEAEVLGQKAPDPPLPGLLLGICLPSNDAFDASLDAAVQVGATEIFPLSSKRSQSPGKDKSARWARMIREACCQSQRSELARLHPISELASFLEGPGPKYLMDPLGDPLAGPIKSEKVKVLVGPEGGLEDSEIQAAAKAGWTRVSLGQGILRVPVAVAAALSALRVLRKS